MAVSRLRHEKRTPLIDRFMAMVTPEPNSGCWLWDGGGGQRYGTIRVWKGWRWVNDSAHRTSFQLFNGTIPSHLEIDHRCGVTWCVNPDHLRLATRQQNLLDGTGRIADFAKATRCKNGHEYTPESTYTYSGTTWRKCRVCNADAAREKWRAKNWERM